MDEILSMENSANRVENTAEKQEQKPQLVLVTLLASITFVGEFADAPSGYIGIKNPACIWYPQEPTEQVRLTDYYVPAGLINCTNRDNKTILVPESRIDYILMLDMKSNDNLIGMYNGFFSTENT